MLGPQSRQPAPDPSSFGSSSVAPQAPGIPDSAVLLRAEGCPGLAGQVRTRKSEDRAGALRRPGPGTRGALPLWPHAARARSQPRPPAPSSRHGAVGGASYRRLVARDPHAESFRRRPAVREACQQPAGKPRETTLTAGRAGWPPLQLKASCGPWALPAPPTLITLPGHPAGRLRAARLGRCGMVGKLAKLPPS